MASIRKNQINFLTDGMAETTGNVNVIQSVPIAIPKYTESKSNVTRGIDLATMSSTTRSYNEWSCNACTFLNPSDSKICDMCQVVRNYTCSNIVDKAHQRLPRIPRAIVAPSYAFTQHNTTLDDSSVPTSVNTSDISQRVVKRNVKSNDNGDGNNNFSMQRMESVGIDRIASSHIPAPTPLNQAEVIGLPENGFSSELAKSGNVYFLQVTESDTIQKEQSYMELENYYCTDLITSLDHFECTVCLNYYYPGEGIVLKDCLHTFCRECLVRAVECNTDAEVKCPYSDDMYQCSSTLQDREIKALVHAEVYEKYLSRSIKQAEQNIENTFHCKTADCQGWCICEKNVKLFDCPVCNQTNCLACNAIHPKMSCLDYQEKLTNDKTNRASQDHLQKLLKNQEAMACPKCNIILMKDVGCDWIRCSVCKLEICWATRGPRWGPKGFGDYSGGCRCKVGGRKCHPKCMNCH